MKNRVLKSTHVFSHRSMPTYVAPTFDKTAALNNDSIQGQIECQLRLNPSNAS